MKKRKTKKVVRRSRSEVVFERLVKAVAAYVEAHGGAVLVAGNVRTLQWPEDMPGNFDIAIRCTGRKPKQPSKPRDSDLNEGTEQVNK